MRVTEDGEVWRDDELVGKGIVRDADGGRGGHDGRARSTIGSELERFAVNTLEYVRARGAASCSSRSSFRR